MNRHLSADGWRTVLAFTLVAACSLVVPGAARAATYYVNDLSYNEPGSVCTAPGNDSNNGQTPATPKRHIQALLNAYPGLGSGNTVWVDPGYYYENVTIGSSHDGLIVQGAGAGRTIVDGGGNDSVFQLHDFDGGALKGFTIRNGSAGEGGGINCDSSSSVISCNHITGNEGELNGGGLMVKGGSPTIVNNVITQNAAYFGAGLYLQNCTPTFANNTLVGNQASSCGGGFYGNDCQFTMANCILWDNESSPLFPNDEIMLRSDAELWIRYCDIMDGDDEIYAWMGAEYHWGPGNLDSNPRFVAPGSALSGGWDVRALFVRTWDTGDYHLQSNSPCIDAGDGDYAPATDMDGNPRRDDPGTPNTGTGNPPFVEMGAYEYGAGAPPFAYEYGAASITDEWQTVNFTNTYVNPILVAGPATYNGLEPGVVRVRNVGTGSCQMRFQEWDYLDGVHSTETVRYLVVEQGQWQIGPDKLLIAGELLTHNTNMSSPTVVDFSRSFSDVPVVVATLQTANGSEAVTDRISNVQKGRFSVALQEQEAGDGHGDERLGYVAVGSGTGGSSAATVDVTIGIGLPAGWDIWIVEEQSADPETWHCEETIGFLRFGGTAPDKPPFIADMQTAYGTDPCSLRCGALARSFRMEHGAANVTGDWQTVSLGNSYERPIVIAGPATYNGADPGVVRVRNVTSGSFEIRFQEWNYLDGTHEAEKVHYLVVERGAWQIGTGRLLLADLVVTSNTDLSNPNALLFPLSFSEAPVVVATQQTANGIDAVTERVRDVQPGGFSVALQEEEAQGVHTYETVAYVAIGPGTGGASAPPQDVWVGTGFPLGWDVSVVEEQSQDAETWHCAETIGYVAFSGVPAGEPPFVADMQTTYGRDPASLRCAALTRSFQLEEGTTSIDHQWKTILLSGTFGQPVVVAGPATYNGTHPGVVRVRNVTPTSFEMRFQEWNYLDKWHPPEQVHWMVVERGAWQIDATKLLVADTLTTSNTTFASPTPVRFPLAFSDVPVVVATQQTANGGDAVTERLSGVDTDRFRAVLQEEEALGPHCQETLGYVAIGTGTGGSSAPVQDVTTGTGPPSGWEVLIVEEQSADSETTHCWENVAHFAFTGTPAGWPPFVAHMQTAYGPDTVSLRCRESVGGGLGLAVASALETLGAVAQQTGRCELSVCAERLSGEELAGVDVVIALRHADGGEETLAVTAPAAVPCRGGDTATLTAPASIFDEGLVLSFERWDVDGTHMAPGITSIEIQVSGQTQAVALYRAP